MRRESGVTGSLMGQRLGEVRSFHVFESAQEACKLFCGAVGVAIADGERGGAM